jgi:CheY-like chemotaxis protein
VALKILLADDSMTAQNMGKKILTDAGYEVIAVSNGAAAVKKIAEVSPHLCILDIYMPGYTGLEVCEKIKASSVTARMPVLLTVGKMEPYKPEEGARVRADGVIVKPFEASELLRAVHRFSQRIAGAQARPGVPPPPSPPASTPATYEHTVKLTREQIAEYMEPSLRNWKGSDVAATAPAARIDVPVEVSSVVAQTMTTSTSDSMPTFAVHSAAVAEQEAPTAVAEVPETPAMVDVTAAPSTAVEELPEHIREEAEQAAVAEVQLPNASAVLPGFVDYLVAQEHAPVAEHAVVEESVAVATETETVEAETLPSGVEAMLETSAETAVQEVAPTTDVAQVEGLETETVASEITVDAAPEALLERSEEAVEVAGETPAIPEAVAETVAPEAVAEVSEAVVEQAAPEAPVEPAFAETIAEAAPVEIAAETAMEAPAETVATAENEFAVTEAHVEQVEVGEASAIPVELEVIQAVEGERSTGTEMLSEELKAAEEIGYKIPSVDPALEVAPDVSVQVTPDPHLEVVEHLHVANATEEGLEVTSRAAESAGVETTADPNLAPMEGLQDAVKPLEGGRLIIPDDEPPTVIGIVDGSIDFGPPVAVESVAEAVEASAAVVEQEVPAARVEAAAAPEAEPVVESAAVVEAAPVAESVSEVAPAIEAAPVAEEATAAEAVAPVEMAPVEAAPAPVEEIAAPPAPVVVEAPLPPQQPSKKSKKGMRPIPAAPPAPVVEEAPKAAADSAVEEAKQVVVEEKPAVPEAAKADVTEEIAGILDMLGQTTATIVPTAPPVPGMVASAAAVEEAPAPTLAPATRVWMAEEVALLDSEASLSLENEMRAAYAPTIVDPETAPAPESCEPAVEPQPEAATPAAPAEEPVRDDKFAPSTALPDTGGSPPESSASPTHELAAAMAAAFGGALPQEDLARAEETQSISEEVRRFALGDAYKAKPTFGGAAIDDPNEPAVDTTKLAAAVSRALDRLKPLLIAEILKELGTPEEN